MSDEDFVRNRPPSYGEFAERPFPGSPDDMMETIATLRARVAKLEGALQRAKYHFVTAGKLHSIDMRGPLQEIAVALMDAPGG